MPFRWTGALTTRYDAKVGWETHLWGLIPLGERCDVLVLGLLFRPRRLGRVGVACHRARPTGSSSRDETFGFLGISFMVICPYIRNK